ncbi:NUDIX hydrolase family protein [Saxibacter everestensis]|uniref:NUDIX hydrolase family protein n=1 Tax=Saxibacter everestensis TaxID=2909229 RepID=A0ABY8QPT7_9MICO|nr:NUDIX hydrolase family protein [Brevibacteriaceae bacterium ZFBP1038]
MTRTAVDTSDGWLEPDELSEARRRLPMVYVNGVPVRVDSAGAVQSIGLLLQSSADGEISRELVSGRVFYHERIRDALLRHIEKDLGPMALPQVPPSPQPFTVAEYFPTEGVSGYFDPRQHAVALAYILPVTGDFSPRQDALRLDWLTPDEAAGSAVQAEMASGQGLVLRQALAHLGFPPA